MQMRKFSAIAAVLSVFALVGCNENGSDSMAPAGDVIKIGEVGSMTGSEATFGHSTHNGIVLAMEELNATGGVQGKKFGLISLDNQGKPEEAATATTRLVTQDGVSAILGEVASSRSLAMAPIAQGAKIPMISPSSTNPKVTEQGDYIFRVCFIDPFQGSVMAKFATENLKVKKVAILRDVKNDYSVGLADYRHVQKGRRQDRRRPRLQRRRRRLQISTDVDQVGRAGGDLCPRLLHRGGFDRASGA
jgi:ABC-type branched-subunit amino acid transport system substrate-binding protein